MTISNPATAAEFAFSWIRETSPTRAQRAIRNAIEGFQMNLGIEQAPRYAPETRENTRAILRTLVAAHLYAEIAAL